jgi:hypothetical protein
MTSKFKGDIKPFHQYYKETSKRWPLAGNQEKDKGILSLRVLEATM